MKRALSDGEESLSKKPRTDRYIILILGMDPTNHSWLVEWSDMTRTWESYDGVKNFDAFRRFIENMALAEKKRHRDVPFYIN